eukprot:3965519-Prymnesium_polylepis.1
MLLAAAPAVVFAPTGTAVGASPVYLPAVTAEPNQQSRELVAFALMRGGPAAGDYELFANSRQCLRGVMPRAILYDQISFHESNVPLEMQLMLHRRV